MSSPVKKASSRKYTPAQRVASKTRAKINRDKNKALIEKNAIYEARALVAEAEVKRLRELIKLIKCVETDVGLNLAPPPGVTNQNEGFPDVPDDVLGLLASAVEF